MPRGGYHQSAERWGRKSGWLNDSVTKTIRVPSALASQVLDLAHKLDEGESIASDTETITSLKSEISKLQAELEQRSGKGNQVTDIEALRDRYLASLKLGRQAPKYKHSLAALDWLIAQLDAALKHR